MASYAQVAARNSEQTIEEASAPAPHTIIPNESLSSDAASYSTGNSTSGSDVFSSSQSGPGGVHVISGNELSELNTTDEQVIHESGPSISFDLPIVHDKTTGDGEGVNGTSSLKDKLKGRKKFSKKDKEIVVFGGLGGVNVLALGVVSYWGYKKYASGENVWKVIGITAGAWVGLSALEFLSVRAFKAWKAKDKSS